jgi:Concanavalin A-like lectin/glucanases superfamily/Putative Ig domain
LPAGTFATSTGPSSNNVPLWIGSSRLSSLLCEIAIDELELFNRAITQSQLQEIFNAGPFGKCRPVAACAPRPAGLLDWWTFDETSGTTASDTAGFVANDGQYNGNPTPVLGIVSGALKFDGIDDHVRVPHQDEVNFTGCGGTNPIVVPLTIDVWVRTGIPPVTSPSSGLLTILDKRDPLGGAQGYHLFLFDGRAAFQINGANFGGPLSGPNFVDVADGQWHFIAVSLPLCAGPGFLFVDGRSIATLPLTSDLDNTGDLFIGARNPIYGNNFFNGTLDELEILGRALTEAELNVIYAAGSEGKCKVACAAGAMSISPATLPALAQGASFPPGTTLAAGGGVAPYQFAVTAGNLPPGLSLGLNGQFSGSAATAGLHTFTVTAVDANGCRAQHTYRLVVSQ